MMSQTEPIRSNPTNDRTNVLVHQIWIGGNPFPEVAIPWRDNIARHLPDWTYKLWTDSDLPALAERSLCGDAIMNHKLGMGIRPDLVRYEILRQHGGLYLDHDMEILGPLDEIMVTDCMHFGFYFPGPKSPGTAILASPAGHSFWENHPLAYAAHHWQGEWFREDAEYKAAKHRPQG